MAESRVCRFSVVCILLLWILFFILLKWKKKPIHLRYVNSNRTFSVLCVGS